jgi:hypothetical protein
MIFELGPLFVLIGVASLTIKTANRKSVCITLFYCPIQFSDDQGRTKKSQAFVQLLT